MLDSHGSKLIKNRSRGVRGVCAVMLTAVLVGKKGSLGRSQIWAVGTLREGKAKAKSAAKRIAQIRRCATSCTAGQGMRRRRGSACGRERREALDVEIKRQDFEHRRRGKWLNDGR